MGRAFSDVIANACRACATMPEIPPALMSALTTVLINDFLDKHERLPFLNDELPEGRRRHLVESLVRAQRAAEERWYWVFGAHFWMALASSVRPISNGLWSTRSPGSRTNGPSGLRWLTG